MSNKKFYLEFTVVYIRKKAHMKPLFWDNRTTIKKIEKMLHKNKVILAEGDTVLGLLSDISEKGYRNLDLIKKRLEKPYLLLVKNKEKALSFVEEDSIEIFQFEKLLNICWPGPVTLIFKAKACVPWGVKSREGNVAIRVPNHKGLLHLLECFDALYSTSANISGKPVPLNIDQVEGSILQAVAGVVFNQNSSKPNIPSTIIDCTEKKIKIVREGAFATEKLKDFLK